MNKSKFKKYSIILRSILVIIILYLIYRETGFFTTLSFLLIAIGWECINLSVMKFNKILDEFLPLLKNEIDFLSKKRKQNE